MPSSGNGNEGSRESWSTGVDSIADTGSENVPEILSIHCVAGNDVSGAEVNEGIGICPGKRTSNSAQRYPCNIIFTRGCSILVGIGTSGISCVVKEAVVSSEDNGVDRYE